MATNKNALKKYHVTILAYEGMTMLDAVGPNEVLANSPYFEVQWASTKKESTQNDHKNFALHGLSYYEDISQTDILLVPGGPGENAVMQDQNVLNWIKALDANTQLTTSVCTGALILAKAGLLNNHKACTHWGCLSELEALGASAVRKRFTQSGKYVTASGVSAGIDMGLYLLKVLVSNKHSKEIRFGIEYFPNQYHLVSSYSLPRTMLNGLSKRFSAYYEKVRKRYL